VTASTCCRWDGPAPSGGQRRHPGGLSITVGICLAAADQLAADGVAAEVLDLRTLVPLDAAAVLASVRRTGRLVIVEENPGQLGWGAAIAAIAAEEAFGDLAAPVARVSGGNVPLPVAGLARGRGGRQPGARGGGQPAVLGHGSRRTAPRGRAG
jgi:hypothetical protein